MHRIDLKEKALHGTTEFPIAIYHNTFDAGQIILAPLHYHSEFEFFLVTKGTILLQTEDTTYRLSEHDALFLNSNQLHMITSDSQEETAFTAIVFEYRCLCHSNDILYTKYIHPLMNGQFHIEAKLTPEFTELLQNISVAYQSSTFGYEFVIKELLLSCFYLLLKNCSISAPPVTSRKSILVREILDYMEANYQETITLEDMSAHVHISKEYLCRIFHQMADVSPITYLNRYRIRKSTELLSETDKSITEIAQLCGFQHSSYFNKQFLRIMGCRPKEYRKRNPFIKNI